MGDVVTDHPVIGLEPFRRLELGLRFSGISLVDQPTPKADVGPRIVGPETNQLAEGGGRFLEPTTGAQSDA
jgi:hypothetical protein